MQLLPGKAAATRITGILNPKYQVHGYSVNLTARKISSLDPTGHIDFGGSEYVAAGRKEIAPERMRPEDGYQWWDLARGSYFVECNETLNLAEDEIAFIEPEDRLLRVGASHVPSFVRGHLAPVELLLEVGTARLRVKENARLARVRLFRITGDKDTVRGLRNAKPRKSKRTERKKAARR
jgi:deoxycytidine triphosphate deaminase